MIQIQPLTAACLGVEWCEDPLPRKPKKSLTVLSNLEPQIARNYSMANNGNPLPVMKMQWQPSEQNRLADGLQMGLLILAASS